MRREHDCTGLLAGELQDDIAILHRETEDDLHEHEHDASNDIADNAIHLVRLVVAIGRHVPKLFARFDHAAILFLRALS